MIIRKDCEKLLYNKLNELAVKDKEWWAIWVHLSQAGIPRNADTLKTFSDTAERLAWYNGEWAFCFMDTGDVILFTQNIASELCQKFADKLSLNFCGTDAPAAKREALCTVYRGDKNAEAFKEKVNNFLAKHSSPPADEACDPATLLTLEYFGISAHRRKKRDRISILIVEDQRFSRQLVMEVLGRKYESITAADGTEALTLYESYAPNMVFLDIDMPRLGGQQVLDYITAVDPDSFIVMLTASNRQDDVEYSLKHGAMGYIAKPFTKEKIEKYLGLYRKNFAA